VSVSPDTIRHYERVGVIPRPARTAAGYRLYPESAIDRILLVRRACRLGFSLGELARFLAAGSGEESACQDIRTAASRILANVDRQVAELTEVRRDLQAALLRWGQQTAEPSVSSARLLEMLAYRSAS